MQVTQRRSKATSGPKGHTFLGAIGAVLGGIIGMIPWLVLSLFGYVSYAGGVLIPFTAYWGYKLFKGRMDKRLLIGIMVVVIVIVLTYLSTVLSLCISVALKSSVGIVEIFVKALLFPFNGSQSTAALWRVLGFSYLFASLTTILLFVSFFRSPKREQSDEGE